MNSCLYECRVMHARLSPQRHRFVHGIFLFALDLDEIPALDASLRFFSAGRSSFYSFRDADYLPLDEAAVSRDPGFVRTRREASPNLKQRVESFCARHGVDITGGRVTLVTLPRVLGYLFNPVSFYFCRDREGRPAAAIAEVTNTFREVKPYFLGPDSFANSAAGGGFRIRVPKHFYVSPFSDVDVEFDFQLGVPGDGLSIQIDDYTGRDRLLTSTLTGIRQPMTSSRLAWLTARHPLITLRIISLIHWHALRLWLKRVPWFAKAARVEDQRGLYRPHRSLHLSDPA